MLAASIVLITAGLGVAPVSARRTGLRIMLLLTVLAMVVTVIATEH
jgi:hypothetical protein